MTSDTSATTTQAVAVGLVYNSLDQILIAKRREPQHLAGLWEFPGGKVEEGESVMDALCRELSEEVDIRVHQAEPFTVVNFSYPQKQVVLHVWKVLQFEGHAKGNEGQHIEWVTRSELDSYPFPEANQTILGLL